MRIFRLMLPIACIVISACVPVHSLNPFYADNDLVFEEKLLAALTQAATAEELVELRRQVERGLAPYRRRMKAEQLALIEKQFMQKQLFERYGLPRLSLFYLPAGGGPAVPVEIPDGG